MGKKTMPEAPEGNYWLSGNKEYVPCLRFMLSICAASLGGSKGKSLTRQVTKYEVRRHAYKII